MLGNLMNIFITSSDEFLSQQFELISSGVSERCLCGAFMLILNKYIQESPYNQYYTDIEYNRNGSKLKTIIDDSLIVIPITCDIIVHSRGTIQLQDNLIAIEMKRSDHPPSEKAKDKARLKALTKSDNESTLFSLNGRMFPKYVCGYVLGVYYEINTLLKVINIEYYVDGDIKQTYIRHY